MCETANQQSISSHMVVYMACKMRSCWLTFRRCFVNCALSRNMSLRDAKPARHLFVWFAKHCLAEHCLSFRGDADECEKQFCFVFRICLAFFDSRLWRPLSMRVLILLFFRWTSPYWARSYSRVTLARSPPSCGTLQILQRSVTLIIIPTVPDIMHVGRDWS